MVTVVTEGIFSYCSFKVKIDTDRWLGPEQATVRCRGEAVGHVTTAEYGSQMLSLGGVHHLTGGSKKEGRVTCEMMMDLGNRRPVELGSKAGHALSCSRQRAGGQRRRGAAHARGVRLGHDRHLRSAWHDQVDEVVVVDDHITGVLTEHQAGRVPRHAASGIRVRGRKSTPGRYFQVANPGTGWGGTDITDPLGHHRRRSTPKDVAWPGMRLLMVSTTGEDAAWFVLDEELVPRAGADARAVVGWSSASARTASRRCATVLFMAGAGGSCAPASPRTGGG